MLESIRKNKKGKTKIVELKVCIAPPEKRFIFEQYFFWYKLPKLSPAKATSEQKIPIIDKSCIFNFEITTKNTPTKPNTKPAQTLIVIFSFKKINAKTVTIIGCKEMIKAFIAPEIP